jgi:hypothetical protein
MPNTTFCNAVNGGNRLNVWNTKPMFSPRKWSNCTSDNLVNSTPFTTILPLSGFNSPDIKFNNVLLPQPLGPKEQSFDFGGA